MLSYLWESGNVNSKKAQVQEKVKHLIAGCLNKFEDTVNLDDLHGFWNGVEFSALTKNAVQEILWELNEMAFRLEVCSLDRCASSYDSGDENHIVDIGKCFPHGKDRVHPVCMDIRSANCGLGYLNWLECAPYLFSLRKLMKS